MAPLARAFAVALGLAAIACGDALIVFGDRPGILRIIAGVPDTPGSRLDSLGTATELNDPLGLAAAGDGTVYIADQRNARVLAVDAAGRTAVVLNPATPGAAAFGQADGLALDGGDRLLVADPTNHWIWSVDLVTGAAASLAGIGVRDSSPDGTLATAAGIDTPTGVALDGDGRVLFSELLGARVRRIESDGTLATVAGTGVPGFSGDGGPASDAQLFAPAGLAVSGRTLYIADSGNHRVRAVDLDSRTITTVVGNGTGAYGGDGGPPTAAMLQRPLAVTASADGVNLFIADNANHRVRIVNLETPVIATFAGTGDEAFTGDHQEAGVTALNRPTGVAASPTHLLFIADRGHHTVWRTAIRFLSLSVVGR